MQPFEQFFVPQKSLIIKDVICSLDGKLTRRDLKRDIQALKLLTVCAISANKIGLSEICASRLRKNGKMEVFLKCDHGVTIAVIMDNAAKPVLYDICIEDDGAHWLMTQYEDEFDILNPNPTPRIKHVVAAALIACSCFSTA